MGCPSATFSLALFALWLATVQNWMLVALEKASLHFVNSLQLSRVCPTSILQPVHGLKWRQVITWYKSGTVIGCLPLCKEANEWWQSRDSWPRESLWRATVPTQLRWSWWGRRTAVFGSVSTTGDWTWRLLVMPTHSPGSRSPWLHWWGPSISRPWTSPVGTTRSSWIPGTSTRQCSRHPSACINTQGCRWAWRQPLPPSSVWCRQPCQTSPSGFCSSTSTTSLSTPRRSTNTWST